MRGGGRKVRGGREEGANEESGEDEEEGEEFEEAVEAESHDLNGNETDILKDSKPKEVESAPMTTTAGAFGSGLKRPLELDEHGNPIIAIRKRRRTGPLTFNPAPPISQSEEPQEEQDDWAGFSDDEQVNGHGAHVESSSEGVSDDEISNSSSADTEKDSG